MTDRQRVLKRFYLRPLLKLALFLLILGGVSIAKVAAADTGGEVVAESEEGSSRSDILKFAVFGAAIAFAGGAIGAGIGVGNVGAAAMGAISEKPELSGQALIFIALAEGIVIFGFIMALLILFSV